jgi:alpha-L-rhamnosidase
MTLDWNGAMTRMPKLASFLLVFSVCAHAMTVHLRTNALENPLGIDTEHPAFAWQSDAKTANWMQSGYEVLVAKDVKDLRPGKAEVWDSGRVTSSESVDISYKGAALESQTRYVWKVLVWDSRGKETSSPAAWFETGLLKAGDWKADWIMRHDPADEQEMKAIRWIWLPGADAMHVPSATPAEFRYRLHLEAKPETASLHVLVRGDFTARVNGTVAGHHNEWGAFDREEIGALLHAGENEIELTVKSHETGSAKETAPAAVAASIHVMLANGKEERIVSDEHWEARPGSSGTWEPAATAGPMSAEFALGTDRQSAVKGPDRVSTDASLLRKDFKVASGVRSARLSITALGAYEAFLDGKRVGPDTMLTPGWTDFHKRVLYQTYDVTSLLERGENTLGVVLAGGWYSSPMTWAGFREYPGPNLLRAQLDVTLNDGSHQTIVTDPSWTTASSPITFAEIYGGESYDARLEQAGWSAPHFDGRMRRRGPLRIARWR